MINGDNNGTILIDSTVSGGGTIDKSSSSQIEVLVGANNVSNQIYAGSGGSTLWGGAGGADTLTGGAGFDEFIYTSGSGSDVIRNAGDNDVVNLAGINLSQIVDASVSENGVEATFQDGGRLRVEGNSNVGFQLEGVTYCANRADGSWEVRN